jgi:hypothetical protein
MWCSTRPAKVFCSNYHSSSNWIAFDVTHSVPKVGSVHDYTVEPTLPKMARFQMFCIEVLGVVAVEFLKRFAE